jgi:N,N'-diacetyllegionaminate synthase
MASASKIIQIGGRTCGAGSPCFIIAEAGVNHNGSVELAHKLVDAAADTGADAVKFQTFTPEALVLPGAKKAEYQIKNTKTNESQLEMLEKLALPRAAFSELQAHARDRKIQFFSTPFDEESAEFLNSIGMIAFKVASGEVTNFPLLKKIARYDRPVLMSTGMCDLAEVRAAVELLRGCGNDDIALFHCVSDYPAALQDCNLRAIDAMRDAFRVPVGWSDHTDGILISVAAAARGAELLEKHLTLDRNLSGPDHKASLEPAQFKQMVADIRSVERTLGDGTKKPATGELKIASLVRKGAYYGTDVKKGTALCLEQVICRRPAAAVSPAKIDSYAGRVLARDVRAGDAVNPGDFI